MSAPTDTPAPITTTTHKRQRARNACLACRRRKRKCDTQYPCSMCTNYGYRCEYPKDESPAAPFVDHPTSPSLPAGQGQSQGQGQGHGQASQFHSQNSVMNVKSIIQNSPSSPDDCVVEKGILDPFKSRYVSQNSAVAFPRSLAADLQSATPLPLHSFGWNCGVRPEEKPSQHGELRDLIAHEEFRQYFDVYWSTVHPIFSFLDRDQFLAKADAYWHGAAQDLTLGAIIGSVVTLGSFFSLNFGHPRELDIVQWVKRVLDDPAICRVPTVDRIIVWILRTVYLRATTRPHVSWLSSCLTLHLTEATGIHHEVQMLRLTTEDGHGADPIASNPGGAERARKVFWLAWSLNKMISYEYGRSPVKMSSITCHSVQTQDGEFTTTFLDLAQQLPSDADHDTPVGRKVRLHEGLEKLKDVPDNCEYICLTKADIALCYYRRLRMLNLGIEKEAVTTTIELGKAGVSAAYSLAQQTRPWWQVLGSVFQYICVLLAIDTAESLAEVTASVDTLEKIARILDTHLAREALTTARMLVRDAVKKKRSELDMLDPGTQVNMAELGPDIDVDWDQFFDPTLSGTFWEIPDFDTQL